MPYCKSSIYSGVFLFSKTRVKQGCLFTAIHERRSFVGEAASQVSAGFAGFRIGQSYQLRYTREFDEVRIEMDHAGAGLVVVSVEQFGKG